MNYVDGFVLPVQKKKVAAYRSMAKLSSKVWLDHGALAFYESVADDVPYGKRTSFPRSVKLKPGETVVFSWITYKSRAQREHGRVMALVAVIKPRVLGNRAMTWIARFHAVLVDKRGHADFSILSP